MLHVFVLAVQLVNLSGWMGIGDHSNTILLLALYTAASLAMSCSFHADHELRRAYNVQFSPVRLRISL